MSPETINEILDAARLLYDNWSLNRYLPIGIPREIRVAAQYIVRRTKDNGHIDIYLRLSVYTRQELDHLVPLFELSL